MDFRLTNNDITYENGDISVIRGKEVVAQSITYALQTIEGEWWADAEMGLPIEVVSTYDLDLIDASVRVEIARHPEIIAVDTAEFSYDDRVLKFSLNLVYQDNTRIILSNVQ